MAVLLGRRLRFDRGHTGLLWCSESPRWLVSKGKGVEAKTVLERMLPHVTVDPASIAAAIEERRGVTRVPALKALKTMFNSFYRNRAILLFIMAIISSNTSGTFTAMMPTFFKAKGLSMSDSLLLVSIMAWGAPAGIILASFSLDKGGRKVPMAIFGIIEAAFIAASRPSTGSPPRRSSESLCTWR